jgi:hypothetical protein
VDGGVDAKRIFAKFRFVPEADIQGGLYASSVRHYINRIAGEA